MQITKNLFNPEELASDINDTITKDVASAKTTTVLPAPDLTNLMVQYSEWSLQHMQNKIICGKSIEEWAVHFKVTVDPNNIESATADYILKKLALINNRLNEANFYLRAAKSKYNDIIANGSDRYLAEYENILKPNGETEVSMDLLLNRNLSKEKIKMVAESKNRATILMAMIALEEKDFFENVVYNLKSNLDILDLILRAKGQEIRLGNYGH